MRRSNTLNDIGNTPLYRLKGIEYLLDLKFELYAKVEAYNPSGSIKDRVADSVIIDAYGEGTLHTNEEVVEATSGNMGIALAYCTSLMDLRCTIFMPSSASKERKQMMEMYGAKVILVDGAMKDAKDAAEKYVKENPDTFYFDQFNNPGAVEAHRATGIDIVNDLTHEDEFPVLPDYLIAGIGTGATIVGVASRLKEISEGYNLAKPVIVGVEPASSPLLTKGETGRHLIQGLGPNFKPSILDTSLIDEVVDAKNEDAYRWTRLLVKHEGLFLGISSGAAMAGLEQIKDQIKEGSKVVVIFPDRGDRYLSVEGLYE